ncbi:MAG: HIT family protein [Limnohabitans sp.]|nr:HIT family protein [Limnohabitans sp.]
MNTACPFCTLPAGRILLSSDSAVVIRDAYPVSPGHTLVIPRRHAGSFFELQEVEQTALLALLQQAKAQLDAEFKPDTFNIGINDGPAGGQTVPHVHVHMIPRYAGDVADARGGVRWLFPDKADYWSARPAEPQR